MIIAKGQGVSIKFVVAYSEEDAAALLKGTSQEVKPSQEPTLKPSVVTLTLKVAGKPTMGAKEKVTVKAITNQASVKATSSKTKIKFKPKKAGAYTFKVKVK